MDRLGFWVRYLEVISLVFAGLGAMWALLGSFDPFGLYEARMAEAFFQRPTLPPEAQRTFAFVLGPFGATSLGYFLLQFFLVRHAFAQRQPWAWRAVFVPFLAWFFLDTAVSLARGALFNVLLANVPSLLAMLPPMLLTRRDFRPGA
jgi:hypothetical protein